MFLLVLETCLGHFGNETTQAHRQESWDLVGCEVLMEMRQQTQLTACKWHEQGVGSSQ